MYQINNKIFSTLGQAKWYKFFELVGIETDVPENQDIYQFILDLPHNNQAYVVFLDEDDIEQGVTQQLLEWVIDNEKTVFLLQPELDNEFLVLIGGNELVNVYGMFRECDCGVKEKHVIIDYHSLNIPKQDWDKLYAISLTGWLEDVFIEAENYDYKELVF